MVYQRSGPEKGLAEWGSRLTGPKTRHEKFPRIVSTPLTLRGEGKRVQKRRGLNLWHRKDFIAPPSSVSANPFPKLDVVVQWSLPVSFTGIACFRILCLRTPLPRVSESVHGVPRGTLPRWDRNPVLHRQTHSLKKPGKRNLDSSSQSVLRFLC